jgi:threonine/homoserine efflux transporter RhtA
LGRQQTICGSGKRDLHHGIVNGRRIRIPRGNRTLLPKTEAPFVLRDWHDAVLLLVLAMWCTLLPYALSLVALRHLSAFTTGLRGEHGAGLRPSSWQ